MEGRYSDFSDFFEENLENLKIISSCPVCNTRYNSSEIRLLDEKNDSHLIYIRCHKCHTSVVAVIFTNQMGVSSMGLVTDLNSDDVMKFRNQEAITVNDVIDVHNFFKANNFQETDL